MTRSGLEKVLAIALNDYTERGYKERRVIVTGIAGEKKKYELGEKSKCF